MDYHSAYIQNKDTGSMILFKVILWSDEKGNQIPIIYQYKCDNCKKLIEMSGTTKAPLADAQKILSQLVISKALDAVEDALSLNDKLQRRVESDRLLKQFAQDDRALCDDCRSQLVKSGSLSTSKEVIRLINYNETPNQDDTEKKADSPELTKAPVHGNPDTVTMVLDAKGNWIDYVAPIKAIREE